MSITKKTTKVKIKSKLIGNRRKDPKEYQKEFNAKFPNLTLLTPYITARQNVTVKCNDCGNIWQAMPLTLLTHKYGCTKCSYKHRGISRRQSQKDFWDKLKKINPNVRIKGKYVTNKQPIEVQCKICGYTWKARPNDLLTGRARCTKCGRAQDIYKRSNFCKFVPPPGERHTLRRLTPVLGHALMGAAKRTFNHFFVQYELKSV